MFGKAEWFRKKRCGCGIVPITWHGWVYSAIWSGVILLPFLAFLFVSRKVPESLLWGAGSITMLLFDVRTILRSMRAKEDKDLLIIDENETGSQLATRNFDMQLRE